MMDSIRVNLPKGERLAIEALAKKTKSSVSALARLAIRRLLDERASESPPLKEPRDE